MKKFKGLIIALSVIIIFAAACGIYLGDFYRADSVAVGAFSTDNQINRSETDNTVVFEPQNPIAGLIFYPGGKVEHTAYEPLMKACADRGILCVLVEMPFNLAVFDINAAEGIQEKFPEIQSWYIGGHSLGGSMAAAYLEKNSDDFEGLVLLGSYSTADLSRTDLEVLSLFGSNDKIMNLDKYIKNRSNLPDDYFDILIDGGCHAYFGSYGSQDGDGIPTISNQEQIRITADAIEELVK